MPNSFATDWLISVDDHVLEPACVWQDRIPSRLRDRAPKLVRQGGEEAWVYDGVRVLTSGMSAVAGREDEFSPDPITYDQMRPGCYDSVARLEDMDRAGILASMCFPSFPRFCGQVFWEAKDKELAMLCVRAYNDWMIEEWCGRAPGRYIPLVIIPLWDPAVAADELRRCAGLGARAFTFPENPAPLGLPTIHDADGYWIPTFEAAQETEMILCMHVGSSSQVPKITPDSPHMADLAWGACRTAGAMISWLYSGLFQTMPGLKIALSEGNVGWIPYFLERSQQVLDTQRHWATKRDWTPYGNSVDGHERDYSYLNEANLRQLYLDHVFGCFIDDIAGLRNLDLLGEDNVMIETDYPHSDSTWPNCMKLAKDRTAHLTPEQQYKVLRGNAERLFRFSPAEVPTVS